MANVLHFQRHPGRVLEHAREHFLPGKVIAFVEYNIRFPNFVIPHPAPPQRWRERARAGGAVDAEMLA